MNTLIALSRTTPGALPAFAAPFAKPLYCGLGDASLAAAATDLPLSEREAKAKLAELSQTARMGLKSGDLTAQAAGEAHAEASREAAFKRELADLAHFAKEETAAGPAPDAQAHKRLYAQTLLIMAYSLETQAVESAALAAKLKDRRAGLEAALGLGSSEGEAGDEDDAAELMGLPEASLFRASLEDADLADLLPPWRLTAKAVLLLAPQDAAFLAVDAESVAALAEAGPFPQAAFATPVGLAAKAVLVPTSFFGIAGQGERVVLIPDAL